MGYRNTWFWHILTIQLQTILLAIIFCCEPFSHWWLLRFSSLLALLAGTWSHGPLYQSTSLYIRYPSFPERNDGTVLQDPFPFCFGCEAVGNFRDARAVPSCRAITATSGMINGWETMWNNIRQRMLLNITGCPIRWSFLKSNLSWNNMLQKRM